MYPIYCIGLSTNFFLNNNTEAVVPFDNVLAASGSEWNSTTHTFEPVIPVDEQATFNFTYIMKFVDGGTNWEDGDLAYITYTIGECSTADQFEIAETTTDTRQLLTRATYTMFSGETVQFKCKYESALDKTISGTVPETFLIIN